MCWCCGWLSPVVRDIQWLTSTVYIRQLRTVRHTLTSDAVKPVIQSFVMSRLDYCNTVLLMLLQCIWDSNRPSYSARTWKFDSISTVLCDELHWLPIRERINYKIGLTVYKYLHQSASAYQLCKPISSMTGRRHLRSGACGDFHIPSTTTIWYGRRM